MNVPLTGASKSRRIGAQGSRWKPYTRNYQLYLLLLPPLVYYIAFHYVPMYGVQIAFKQFNATLGISGSPWIGFTHFERFFSYYNFTTILTNTVVISLYALAVGFFTPILLAIMINEVRHRWFRKLVQNATYMPHFLSVVVVVGMMVSFTSLNSGVVNRLIELLGGTPIAFMMESSWFKTLFVMSNVWEHMGWNAIIYLAALAGISPELYEAAIVDGAGKWKRIIHVSIPGIMSTVIVLLILRVGQLLNVGFEKILLMQNDANLSASDVISTYLYRSGLLEGQFSYAAAVGLFNSVCNFAILILANYLARRMSENSLW
ncbi:ABC transporter permease [Cohnella cellulosilytica]|uniref:ABC transporter permease n=1 Tax=Cohnella cellulosilytica TaxID=986710 RepID=A0ABW2FDA0_9BACL